MILVWTPFLPPSVLWLLCVSQLEFKESLCYVGLSEPTTSFLQQPCPWAVHSAVSLTPVALLRPLPSIL